jgi:Cd2+/Zn2+-exporting ATPase
MGTRENVMSQTIQLNLALLLADVDSADACVHRLSQTLALQKGIEQAHIVRENGSAQLCLHYDPNRITLTQVQRLAEDAGTALSDRYRHEQIPFVGLDAADSATTLSQELERLQGVIHANANYAAGLVFVAYDSTVVQRPAIEQTIRRMGARLLPSAVLLPAGRSQPATGADRAALEQHEEAGEHAGHEHGSAPAFLPHWMQERWTLILVALAGVFFLVGWAGENFFDLPESVALIFFILAYIAGGYDIATHAIPGLFRCKFNTDVLMLAAAAGAAILGEWSEGAFLLFLFALGHAGEHYALDRARNAVNALGNLMPQLARVRRGDQIQEVNVAEVLVGEVVVVRPGDRMPVDGTVASGRSTVDQSPITGESVPVRKQPGDEVFAGTINQDAALDVTVTRLAKDNTLSRVMRLVAEAQSQQSPTQQFTERFTAWFVPAVLIAVALFIVVPPLVGWMPLNQSVYRAMLLLVAASPCALALGTPATVLAGIAQVARNGVLIKGGVHLENLGSLNAMAFDKTGTLTEGTFAVTDVVSLNGATPDEILRIAAAVEQQSNHPLAQAVVRAAREKQLQLPAAAGLDNIPGRGVRSVVGGQEVLIGTLKLFEETNGHATDDAVVQAVERLEASGRSTMAISQGGRFLGVLGLADTPRVDVKQTLQQLRDLGVQHLVMLTGDNDDVAKRIANEVGVTDVRAELLPEDKLTAIKDLSAQYGAIAMTGDGVNDAPALATATVGIAMGGAGTAVALETADVALMADDLRKLPFAVGLSRASRAIIRQNLGISLGVIGLLLVTSVLGLVQLSWAVVLHEGSTIVVVLNALRLLGYRLRSDVPSRNEGNVSDVAHQRA